jgi:hypothetical protein
MIHVEEAQERQSKELQSWVNTQQRECKGLKRDDRRRDSVLRSDDEIQESQTHAGHINVIKSRGGT